MPRHIFSYLSSEAPALPGLLATKDATYDEAGHRIPHRNSATRKAVGLPSAEVARDLARGRNDIPFFAERFLGIILHPGQVRWAKFANAVLQHAPWLLAFLTIVVSAGNRAGKTLGLAVIILHHTFYKVGIRQPRPGDAEDSWRWTRLPYHWYHVAPQKPIAALVYDEIVTIATETHPAQYDRDTGVSRGCPLVRELGAVISWDKKEDGEYLWVRIHPMFGGGEIHFRSTDEKAKALLGLDANGISADEVAFELYLDMIRHEVFHFRRLSTGGPLYAIGTPTQGLIDFEDWWAEGDLANPDRDPRVVSLRLSTRDNVGFGITPEVFEDLLRQTPEYLIPQNIDGHFIEAIDAYFHAPAVEAVFMANEPAETAPQSQHRYVQGVDPGISSDATGAIVLDYTSKPIRGVRIAKRAGRQAIPAVVNMVREGHLLYQQDGARSTTILDSTGMGGKMFRQEFSIIKPLRDYDFAGTKAKKLELLSDLKAVIDRGDLRLPKSGGWLQLRRQLLGYKLDDKRLETDLVMALALAVRHATRNSGEVAAKPTFKYYG